MKIERASGIPLVTHDPFFSIWSFADRLNERHTAHWTGKEQRLYGYVRINGIRHCFMGEIGSCVELRQKSIDVTATATEYVFENDMILLSVRFTSPLILSEPVLVSRPCTYVDFHVIKKQECTVEINFEVFHDLVSQHRTKVIGDCLYRPKTQELSDYHYAYMGRANQTPLGGSGDMVTIDWGYVYLASSQENAKLSYNHTEEKIACILPAEEMDCKTGLILAYDDILSINYFGEWRKAYWTKHYASILDAIAAAFTDRENVMEKAAKLDAEIHETSLAIGGEDYAFLCNMSYRQTVSAHKLICDEKGDIIFLSKENNSNGCIGTVDVSYPSVPLFLLYDTEYVKGMLRPIFRFAECDIWEEEYAPHDVGRYPYAWGQYYGIRKDTWGICVDRSVGGVIPPYYMYPKGSNIYDFTSQMPIEECGNMLIMSAIISKLDGNTTFVQPYMKLLEKWTEYLVKYGADPGDQLCTDDFAGHLAHNVNLSAKAVLGIEACSILMGMFGNVQKQKYYHDIAKKMAADWEKRADAGDHYVLAFDSKDSWSLKYNLIWDKLFHSNLFSQQVYEKEIAWYIQKCNRYGVPLDSRSDRSKTDWILWCASMTDDRNEMERLIEPVAYYLKNTLSRVAFSDKYWTTIGEREGYMARSVQGGIYMPILKIKLCKEI